MVPCIRASVIAGAQLENVALHQNRGSCGCESSHSNGAVDLAYLNSLTSQLHLIINTTQYDQRTIRKHSAHISRSVKPPILWMLDKLLLRKLRHTEIALSDLGTAKAEFSHPVNGYRVESL